MRRMLNWLTMALVCAGLACTNQANNLEIQSFNGTGQLVFNTLNSATNYCVEWASSPAGPWTNVWTGWVPLPSVQAGSVTCSVPMFYRVVAAVTNAWLVIDVAGDLDFDNVLVGTTATRTLTLRNRGGADMTVSGITYPDGFSGDWTGVIHAGWEQDVTVTFKPLEYKEYGGTVTVASDSASGNNTLAVTGTGVGDYLVIDVAAGPSAVKYPVSYPSDIPSGGWVDAYKTTKIVMRRIPATTSAFTMGSPIGELGRQAHEVQHDVTLSQGFYICVFEVTQRQWELVMGNRPSYFNNDAYYATRPVEQVSYDDIRGSSAGAGWPTNSGVDAASFMGRLRAKTGKAFDLPTESQWEYACRAGTATALNSGYNLASTTIDAHVNEVARYWYNGGSSETQSGSTGVGSAKAGSFLPNAWGLYDMHGNVWEWCLDWYGAYPGAVSDPVGAPSGTYHVYRGGAWNSGAAGCRSAYRFANNTSDTRDRALGFRAVLPSSQP